MTERTSFFFRSSFTWGFGSVSIRLRAQNVCDVLSFTLLYIHVRPNIFFCKWGRWMIFEYHNIIQLFLTMMRLFWPPLSITLSEGSLSVSIYRSRHNLILIMHLLIRYRIAISSTIHLVDELNYQTFYLNQYSKKTLPNIEHHSFSFHSSSIMSKRSPAQSETKKPNLPNLSRSFCKGKVAFSGFLVN